MDEFNDGRETKWINSGFIRDLEPVEFSVVVPDIQVFTTALDNISWRYQSKVSEEVEEKIKHVYGMEQFRNEIKDQESGCVRLESAPEQDLAYIGEMMAEDIDIVYPDHLRDCIVLRRNQYRGTGYFSEVDSIADDMISGIPMFAEPLRVKKIMGIKGQYSKRKLEERYHEKNEDDLMLEAIEEELKEDEVAVATYDSDFLESDIPAYPPELLYQMSGVGE